MQNFREPLKEINFPRNSYKKICLKNPNVLQFLENRKHSLPLKKKFTKNNILDIFAMIEKVF